MLMMSASTVTSSTENASRSSSTRSAPGAAGTPVLIGPDQAALTATQVGNHIAGRFSFGPLYAIAIERGLFTFALCGHSQQRSNGVRHLATLADHTAHIIFRNTQLKADAISAPEFPDFYLVGVFHQ